MIILEDIADKTRERIQFEKEGTDVQILLQQIEERKDGVQPSRTFRQALLQKEMSFICEVKKASLSNGMIVDKFPYLEIAEEYEAAGASAVSVLTEPFYFEGSDQYLWEIAGRLRIPVLRKDYVIDEYMVYQARALGASAILLICGILDDHELKAYRELALSLGMDSMFEAHSEAEVTRALDAGAQIISGCNRDFITDEIDMMNSIQLRKMVPDDVLFVSEGGIRTHEDVQLLRNNGISAVLVGEAMMKSDNRKKTLQMLAGGR